MLTPPVRLRARRQRHRSARSGSASANLWPVYIGIKKGFFAAENIKIDIIYVQSSANLVQQLAAGSLDISMSTGLVDPIRAIDQKRAALHRPLRGAGAALCPGRQGEHQEHADLKGKVISVGGAKDITRIYVERMLAPHGVKPGEFDMVFAGATSARASALLAGAVDAAILLPPFNFQAERQGFNNLGLTVEYAPELPFSGTVVNKALGREEPGYCSSGFSPRTPRASNGSMTTRTATRRSRSWSSVSQPQARRRGKVLRLLPQDAISSTAAERSRARR